jgi:hypothetical protein
VTASGRPQGRYRSFTRFPPVEQMPLIETFRKNAKIQR